MVDDSIDPSQLFDLSQSQSIPSLQPSESRSTQQTSSPESHSDKCVSSPKQKTQRTLQPNLTRRSHKKSRNGCLPCKARKVKCQETRPACENCILKELDCKYPKTAPSLTKKSSSSSTQHSSPSSAPSIQLPLTQTSDGFSLADMRVFAHFLTIAYPHLPLGNDSVWIHQVPAFAQHYSYLMHAILSLGASHLTRVAKGVDYNTLAIQHRGKAIQGLNQALAKNSHSYGEADAMLASCYALTFQASYMSDGLVDFLTMVRGCALVTDTIRNEGVETAFFLETNNHLQIMKPRLSSLPAVEVDVLDAALPSLQALSPYLTSGVDHHFHTSIQNVILALRLNSTAGYLTFISVYGSWYFMPHNDFQAFISQTNQTAQLLLAHFVAVQLVMVPLTHHEWPERANHTRLQVIHGITEWIENIYDKVEDDLKHLLEWPMMVVGAVRAEIEDMDCPGWKVLQLAGLIESSLNVTN